MITLFLSIELVLIVSSIILEFTKFKYDIFPNWIKCFYRVIMILPLIGITFCVPFSLYLLLISVILFIVILADIGIVFNFIVGLGLFFVCHILNIINFCMISDVNLTLIFFFLIFLTAGWYIYFSWFFEKINGLILNISLVVYLLALITELSISLFLGIYFTFGIFAFLGVLLFSACDIEVAYLQFIKKFNLSQQLNNLLYYGGLLLLTLSVIFK